jgi:predicted amidophosphoribosyltransferase
MGPNITGLFLFAVLLIVIIGSIVFAIKMLNRSRRKKIEQGCYDQSPENASIESNASELESGNLCSKCGGALHPGAQFCKQCGAPAAVSAAKTCPGCGAEIASTAKFCKRCGVTLN